MSLRSLLTGLIAGKVVQDRALCGHRTHNPVRLSYQGEESRFFIDLPRDHRGKIIFCASCLSHFSVTCAWCSRLIFVGELVTAYPPPAGFLPPVLVLPFQLDPPRYVGCVRSDCCDGPADIVGRLGLVDNKVLVLVS